MTRGRPQPAVVRVQRVTKVFPPPPAPWRRLVGLPPPAGVVALRDVDLEIAPGEVLGLVGPNGAGKTVLLKLIATLSEPTAGEISVFGYDSLRASRDIRLRIGMATCDERSFYWRLTGRQNLMFFARLIGLARDQARRRMAELFELLAIQDVAQRPYRTLSSGNRQRLAIARALLNDPALLLLDEPTNSLDPNAAERLRALIKERVLEDRERAILVTSHNLEEVEHLSSRVAILGRGRILETADLETLRRRHGAARTVTVAIRSPLPEETWLELSAIAPGLRRGESRNGVFELSFEREAQDGALHRFVAELIRRGAEIVGVRERAPDLKTIFDTLVGRGGGSA